MFDLIQTLVILIPALPLAATLLTAVLGLRVLRAQSHWPTILCWPASSPPAVVLVFAVGASRPSPRRRRHNGLVAETPPKALAEPVAHDALLDKPAVCADDRL